MHQKKNVQIEIDKNYILLMLTGIVKVFLTPRQYYINCISYLFVLCKSISLGKYKLAYYESLVLDLD